MAANDFARVAPDLAYRLFNLGATTLVSAGRAGDEDVMPASWVCPLDLRPFLVTAVIDRSHYTRRLIEREGRFALQLPTAALLDQVMTLGSVSMNDCPDKLERAGVSLFRAPGRRTPLVRGCACWALFEVVSEPGNEDRYDLFIGRCFGAWADPALFRDGWWRLDEAAPERRLLHYISDGRFFTTGPGLNWRG